MGGAGVPRLLRGCSVVLGLHPDQATELIAQFAATHRKPLDLLWRGQSKACSHFLLLVATCS